MWLEGIGWKYWPPSSCLALKDPNTFYIIDPARGQTSAEIVEVAAHTIIPPSPDSERLGDWRKAAECFYIGA